MDTTVKRSSNTSRLARAFAKVLNIRAVMGLGKTKSREQAKRDHQSKQAESHSNEDENEKLLKDCLFTQAFMAKLFACLSSIKAAYAHMQFAQSPYDADAIQLSDQTIVSELKDLSELKQCYLKKGINDSSPDIALALAEIQEQRSLLKMHELTRKKLDFQLKLKDSEIIFLQEKLAESSSENRLLERNLNSSTQLAVPDGIRLSDLNTGHFSAYHRQVIKSVRGFVGLLVREMESAGWDLDAAASAAQPGISLWKRDHRCFAFESYVCRRMLDGFGPPDIRPESGRGRSELRLECFALFREMRAAGPVDYLSWKPGSPFALFCRERYLKVVHPKMEGSLFGDLEQRELVGSGRGIPATGFFTAFCEMAKRVWLLRCLAACLEGEARVFEVGKGSRFSEVYMESLSDEAFWGNNPRVGFTVVPGFRVGRTVVQCQVYLC